MHRLAVLMTCYNRALTTLTCLENVYAQTQLMDREVTIYVVDDASSDDTASIVQARFPKVRLIHGAGNLYWNGGMRVAFQAALEIGFDSYLWLNDDTSLVPSTLDKLLCYHSQLSDKGIPAILVGSTRDEHTGAWTYGGLLKSKGLVSRRLSPVLPAIEGLTPCDTMNGNCTLIPGAIARRVGNLDRIYTHSFGDLDYGFRARLMGFPIYVVPGYVGTCTKNSIEGTWRDRSLPLSQRLRNLRSAKGSPIPEWVVYCRRHLGPVWPLYAISPYVKTAIGGLLKLA